jgi:hypothetical protein
VSAEGTAFRLEIGDTVWTPPDASADAAVEWDFSWEERIDGVGTASFTLQDRENEGPEFGRVRDEIKAFIGDDRIFHGEITKARLELPVGHPFRRWKITASDYNTILDLRLVGTPDGSDFTSIDGGKTHTPLDPHAHCRATDRLTVEWLFEKYAKMPDGSAIDATTFVRHYVNKYVLYNKHDKPVLWWRHVTLREALNELANMAGFPIFYWMDPNDKFHWVNFADFEAGLGSLPKLMPKPATMINAPAIITDHAPDHVTTIGFRDYFVEEDAAFMPEQVYIVGATDNTSADGQTVTYQGTGFGGRGARDITKRQILVDTQSLTEAQKDATAKAYKQFNKRGRIKGSVTIGTHEDVVDGWHCGQKLRFRDVRSPHHGKGFPIHRVSGRLSSGNDFRVYTLEFGDAPIGRFGQHYKAAPQRLAKKRLPASEHKLSFPTLHLRPDSEYVIHSQMVDTSGQPFAQGGVSVEWSLVAVNRLGASVGTGVIAPFNSIVQFLPPLFFKDTLTNVTDEHGRAAATLTTGPLTDIWYHVRAVTPPQFALPEGAATT